MLRKVIFPIGIFIIAYLVMPSSIYAQNKFEGTQVCGVCHKTEKQGLQLKIWQDSKHADAYKTLQTAEAKKLSPDVDPVKNQKCLKCHVAGAGLDASHFGPKFKIEDGVQCEACHGAGSAYKSLKVMKSREESVKNGLIVWKDKAEIREGCVKCHNSESPTYKEFDFEKMWAKIAHPVPKG